MDLIKRINYLKSLNVEEDCVNWDSNKFDIQIKILNVLKSCLIETVEEAKLKLKNFTFDYKSECLNCNNKNVLFKNYLNNLVSVLMEMDNNIKNIKIKKHKKYYGDVNLVKSDFNNILNELFNFNNGLYINFIKLKRTVYTYYKYSLKNIFDESPKYPGISYNSSQVLPQYTLKDPTNLHVGSDLYHHQLNKFQLQF